MLAIVLLLILNLASCLQLAPIAPEDVLVSRPRLAGMAQPNAAPKERVALQMPLGQVYLNGTESPIASRRLRRDLQPPGWAWKPLEDYRGYLYFISIELGEPTQTVKLALDTGSWEMWVNPNCTAAADEAVCESNGHYALNVSKHIVDYHEDFGIAYGTGDVSGGYYGDWLYLREVNIVIGQQFGVANDSSVLVSGVFGLGFGDGVNMNYYSPLDTLVAYQWIYAPIFAIGLGGQGDGFSEICFGGINRYKYIGYLEPVPIWPPVSQQQKGWAQYRINMSSFGVNLPSGVGDRYTVVNATLNMLIDTGRTFTYMFPQAAQVIAEDLGGWWDDGLGEYMVNCTMRSQNGTVNFGFNNDSMVIRVSYHDFVVVNQDNSCSLGVQPTDGDNTLGDTFIRGAYLVHDQQTDTIWMGNYYNCGDGVSLVGETAGDASTMYGMCGPYKRRDEEGVIEYGPWPDAPERIPLKREMETKRTRLYH